MHQKTVLLRLGVNYNTALTNTACSNLKPCWSAVLTHAFELSCCFLCRLPALTMSMEQFSTVFAGFVIVTSVVVPVAAPGRSRCHGRAAAAAAIGMGHSSSGGATEARGPSGILASLTAYELGVGTSSCPWLIVGIRGQRINLTLMDFAEPYQYSYNTNGLRTIPLGGGGREDRLSTDNRNGNRGIDRRRSLDSHQGPRYCREYAAVSEEGDVTSSGVRNLVVCSGDSRYGSPPPVVYTSATHRVRVTFVTPGGSTVADGQSHEGPYFALRYDGNALIFLAFVAALNSVSIVNRCVVTH